MDSDMDSEEIKKRVLVPHLPFILRMLAKFKGTEKEVRFHRLYKSIIGKQFRFSAESAARMHETIIKIQEKMHETMQQEPLLPQQSTSQSSPQIIPLMNLNKCPETEHKKNGNSSNKSLDIGDVSPISDASLNIETDSSKTSFSMSPISNTSMENYSDANNNKCAKLNTSPVSSYASTSPISSQELPIQDKDELLVKIKECVAKSSDISTVEDKDEVIKELEEIFGGKEKLEKFKAILMQQGDSSNEVTAKAPLDLNQSDQSITIEPESSQQSTPKPKKSSGKKGKTDLDFLHTQIKEMYYGNDILALKKRSASKPADFYSDERNAKMTFHEIDDKVKSKNGPKKSKKEIKLLNPKGKLRIMKPKPTSSANVSSSGSIQSDGSTSDSSIKRESMTKKSSNAKVQNNSPDSSSEPQIKVTKRQVNKVVKTETLQRVESKLMLVCYTDISNIMFSLCRKGVLFVCKLCSFETCDKNVFLNHIESKHQLVKWSRYCNTCKKTIEKSGNSLKDELKHLETHLVCIDSGKHDVKSDLNVCSKTNAEKFVIPKKKRKVDDSALMNDSMSVQEITTETSDAAKKPETNCHLKIGAIISLNKFVDNFGENDLSSQKIINAFKIA